MADTQILAGTSSVAAQAMVSADQVTVLGNGTRQDPLRLASGFATSFVRPYAGSVSALPGRPVVFSVSDPGTVRPADAVGADQVFRAIGLITALRGDDVLFQSDGIVTLPTAAWDLVTGGSGGLLFGPYYVSTVLGHLTRVAPTTSGTRRVQVGISLSRTSMILTTPSQGVAIP